MTRALDEALKQAADISVMAYTNLLINGFMPISQENGNNALTGTAKYPVDQFMVSTTVTALTTQQVSNPFPSQPDIPAGVKLTATAASAVGANDVLTFYQSIEGLNLARLRYGAVNAKPVTLAFMLRPTFTGVAGFSLVNMANNPVFRSITHRVPLIANQDNFFCFTLPGDQAAALLLNNAASIQARWCFMSGATYQTAALDAWQVGNFCAPPDISNLFAVAGQSVLISGCVMIPGAFTISQDSLPLLQRRWDDELRLCQRYFRTLLLSLQGYSSNAALRIAYGPTFPDMRTTPSVTLGASSSNLGAMNAQAYSNSALFAYIDTTGVGNAYDNNRYAALNARM